MTLVASRPECGTGFAAADYRGSPQAALLPLLRRDRLADAVTERLHLHVVGRGPAGERELVPLPLALERAAAARHRRVRDFRLTQRTDHRTLGPIAFVLADAPGRLEIADLLEACVGIELLEHALDLRVICRCRGGKQNPQCQCNTMQRRNLPPPNG